MTEQQLDKNSQLFVGLISSLTSQAYIQLGKLKNPMTDKIERDLDGASLSIDIIAMLKEKSDGNLSPDESTFLERTLHELRLNYVSEKEKPEPEPEPVPDDKDPHEKPEK